MNIQSSLICKGETDSRTPLDITDARDFLGPVAKTLLPKQGAWVGSLVRELDPTCMQLSLHATVKSN